MKRRVLALVDSGSGQKLALFVSIKGEDSRELLSRILKCPESYAEKTKLYLSPL